MSAAPQNLDPVTFEILSHRLHQTAKEMGTALERVGGTVNTTQMHDYMAALYRPGGEILAVGESLPMHVACAACAVKRIIEQFAEDEGIHSDDVFLLNDPYVAAYHQSDVYMISPIHYREQLVGWSASFVHVMDIGAMSAGGESPEAKEICQEGIRIPGIKLVERGKLRKDVFNTIINMTRRPAMVALDLRCQLAGNNVAKARMLEMFERYGPELMHAASEQMIRHSAEMLSKRLAGIPDGKWSDAATLQSGENSWTMRLNLTKEGSRLRFDFTGTDRQADTGINLPYHATCGTCFEELLGTIAYDLPKNHGLFAPIEVIAPEGTLVNVRYPGPVSLNTTSGGATSKFLARSVLTQMLAGSEEWAREVRALNAGGRLARTFGVNQYGMYYASSLAQPALTGGGARSYADGVDSGQGSYLVAPNVEWLEMNCPLLFLFRRHVKDGQGAGKFRGGAGAEMAFTVHKAPEGKIRGVAFGVAGLRNGGRGVFGGYSGAPSILKLVQGTRLTESLADGKMPEVVDEIGGQGQILSYCEFELKPNDVLYYRLGQGGGYGDPLEREPRAVLQDVRDGYVSEEQARRVYGIVLSGEARDVDAAGTRKLREEIRAARKAAEA